MCLATTSKNGPSLPHTPSSQASPGSPAATPLRSVNVTLGPREDRMLITGLHTVCDIYCITCNCVLGWKYEVRGRCCGACRVCAVQGLAAAWQCAVCLTCHWLRQQSARWANLACARTQQCLCSERGACLCTHPQVAYEESQKYKEGKYILEKVGHWSRGWVCFRGLMGGWYKDEQETAPRQRVLWPSADVIPSSPRICRLKCRRRAPGSVAHCPLQAA